MLPLKLLSFYSHYFLLSTSGQEDLEEMSGVKVLFKKNYNQCLTGSQNNKSTQGQITMPMVIVTAADKHSCN